MAGEGKTVRATLGCLLALSMMLAGGCKQTAELPPDKEPATEQPAVEPMRIVKEHDMAPPTMPAQDRPVPAAEEEVAPDPIPEVWVDWTARRDLSPDEIFELQGVFSEKCAPCHGPVGKGDGPMVDRLPQGVPDLTDQATQSLSDGELFWVITEGRLQQNKMMPGFTSLDEATRQGLVSFVRWLADANQRETAAPEKP